jgi:predicted outer membrane protein
MSMTSHLGKRVLKHSFIFTTTLLTCTALQADHNDQHGDKTQQFIQKAAMGGQMEVQMGQLAEQKGQAQEVKSLGATLVRDHTQANQRLEQLASSKNITIDKSSWSDISSTTGARSTVTTPDSTTTRTDQTANTHVAKHEYKELDKLQSQSGAEFDKTFVRMAIKDHKKDISEFERARADITDPEIKAQNAARVVGVSESSIAADREDDTTSNSGAPAAGAVGTRGSDKPSSPASNPTLNQQSSSFNSDRNDSDHSVSASAQADKADQNVSASIDTTKKHKAFSTDKNDGKFLGIIPDPFNKDHHKGPSAGADVNVNGHEASVGASAGSESSSSSSRNDDQK